MMDYDIKEPFVVKPVPGGEAGVRGSAITMAAKGKKSGDIDGGAPGNMKGADKQFQLMYYQSAIMSPRDPQSGLPTGQRMHMGVEVVGRNCKGVPLLWNVISTNETLTSVVINFWSQHGAGAGVTQAIYYYVTLTNASIATMEHMTSEIDGTLFFRARLTYQKIEWNWKQGGITATDDWIGAD
jgi:type VI secretion system secreted protein Hcp